MADTTHTIGSTGKVKKMYDLPGEGGSVYGDAVGVGKIALYPVTPVVTAYAPSTTAYLKVTPNALNLDMVVRARTTSDDLIYAGIITHKIADTTNTIAASDATNLATSKTLAAEVVLDVDAHRTSTTYHVTAGSTAVLGHKAKDTVNTIAAADMSDLATGYTLIDELCTDFAAHANSTTYHLAADPYTFAGTPNSEALLRAKVNALRTAMLAHLNNTTAHFVNDPVNLALVTATTIATDQSSDQTLINLLKTYHASHLAIFDPSVDLAGVVVCANAKRAGMLTHFADTAVHGGIADAADLATLTAVPVASDQTTANTLLNAEKSVHNLHVAITDNGSYQTVPSGLGLSWPCAGSFFCRTSTSGGVFTTSEFRSA